MDGDSSVYRRLRHVPSLLPPTSSDVRVSVNADAGSNTIDIYFSNEDDPDDSVGDNEGFMLKYDEGIHDAAWFEDNGIEFTGYFIITSNSSYTIFAKNMTTGSTVAATFEITNILDDGNAIVTLNQTPTIMIVTVPMALPVTMSADGGVITATDAEIINGSFGPVYISSVTMSGRNGWIIIPWDSDFAKLKVDSNQLAFTINGNPVDTDGAVNDGIGVIDGHADKQFDYDAKVTSLTAGADAAEIASIVFVVDWYEGEII